MFERRVLQRMTRSRRVEQVADHHRVEDEACQRDPVLREHHRIELGIVSNFRDGRILEHRPQRVENLASGEALFAEERTLLQRHVPRSPGAGGERDAHDGRKHRRRSVWEYPERKPPGRAQLRDERGEALGRGHGLVLLVDRFRRRRILHRERAEAEA
jgi:hypothetical protein